MRFHFSCDYAVQFYQLVGAISKKVNFAGIDRVLDLDPGLPPLSLRLPYLCSASTSAHLDSKRSSNNT